MASMLNKSAVRQFLLDYAAREKAHKFTRVGGAAYEYLESRLRDSCRSLVNGQPSKGKTIIP